MATADSTHKDGGQYRTLSIVLLSVLGGGLMVMFGVFGLALLGSMFNMPLAVPEETAPIAAAAAPNQPEAQSTPPAAPGGGAPDATAAVTPPSTPPAGAAPGSAVDPAFAALGAQMYTNCLACHGADGKGAPVPVTPPMAPPLAGSQFVAGPVEPLAMILLNGIQHEGRFTGIMVSMKPIMDDEKMAAVLTHIRSNFGNSAPPVTAEQVAKVREKYADRATPFLRSELETAKGN